MGNLRVRVIAAILATGLVASSMAGCSHGDTKDTKVTEDNKELADDIKKYKDQMLDIKETKFNLDDTVLKVDNDEISVDDIMYYWYTLEREAYYYEFVYKQQNTEYLDADYEDGVTYREQYKSYIKDQAIMYNIFYKEAVDKGMELTEDEKKQVKSDAQSAVSSMTDQQKELLGATQEKYEKLFEVMQLASKRYAEVLDGLGVDEEAAKESVDIKDYTTNTVEYICGYFKETTTDEDGNEVTNDKGKDEKAKIKKELQKMAKKAVKGTDFAEIVKDNKVGIDSGEITYTKGDKTFSTKIEKQLNKLKEGEVTGLIEDGNDYMLIYKMKTKDDTSTYANAQNEAVETAKSEAFEKYWKKELEKHDIEELDAFKDLKFGTLLITDDFQIQVIKENESYMAEQGEAEEDDDTVTLSDEEAEKVFNVDDKESIDNSKDTDSE